MTRRQYACDLHVHSRFSTRPSEWILQKIGCAESYTDPHQIYETAQKRGMDFVTVTDHNTIDGALDIAHLPGVFISEEITTYFPEDGCKLHVLAWDITEKHHAEFIHLRDNVYDLAAYLRQESIVHAIAHPMFDMNGRLTAQHFEKMLLLFKVFELNGSRDQSQNEVIKAIISSLTEEDINCLANKHDMAPPIHEPWIKSLTGGSDDHSSLNIARSHTTVPEGKDINSFLKGVAQGASAPVQDPATPATMAHNLYSIAYQFYRDRFGLEKVINKDFLFRYMDRALTLREPQRGNAVTRTFHDMIASMRARSGTKHIPEGIEEVIQRKALEIIWNDKEFRSRLSSLPETPRQAEQDWFTFVDRASERILNHFADTILESLGGANVFDLFKAVGAAGSSYLVLAPYMVAYTLFTKDRALCREALGNFLEMKGQPTERRPMRLAHFTDTYHEMNGVAVTLRSQVESAARFGFNHTVITCVPDAPSENGVKNFTPIGSFELPEYPEQKMHYPPLLKMMDWCYRNGITHIHAATPGPVGMAALACARILRLPIHSTYHTAFPQYVSALTGDAGMEEVMWKFMVWFSNQCDAVYAPSKAMASELAEKGVHAKRIRAYPRGVDVERFHPSLRNGFFQSRFNLPDDEIKLLYVGRISKEKNLHNLAESFRMLSATRSGVRLVIVGKGPYEEEMRQELKGFPVTFTGPLYENDLSAAYASSDLFVFPSTTDTFGNVVLEAQASGLPVIVTDLGGPQENVIPGKTGLIVPEGDPKHMHKAIETLVDDPARIAEMKLMARASVADRSFERAYCELWRMYRDAPASRASRN